MGGNSKVVPLYITICVITFIVSKLIMTIICYRRWKRKQMVVQDSLSGGKLVMFKSPKINSFKSNMLLKKTMKLSNKDKIGAGGYGTVYKLTINESTSFAVKKLNRISAEQDRGFERELEAMGDIKHRNIVTLHGYYSTAQYNLLIYELMPNGSLDQVLHGKCAARKVLDWPSRYKIAVGAARGLSYLHHDCIPHVIHRDIKSSNILLDHNMEARVSDFGLATLMEPDKTHVSTLVAGTFGYLPPEYFDTGKATVKGDVYSFGVVLLELLTGKKPTDEAFIEEGTKLVTWVKAVVQDKREEYVVDRNLEEFPIDEINHVFSIAMTCLEAEPYKRPTMAEVVKMLDQIKMNALSQYMEANKTLSDLFQWSCSTDHGLTDQLEDLSLHFSATFNPLATDDFSEGETGSPPRSTSKSATFVDSIVTSTEEGIIPSKESETFKISKQ